MESSHAYSYSFSSTVTLIQNRELKSEDLAVRQQALLLLNDVMHRRENLASALKEGQKENTLWMLQKYSLS